MVIKCPVDVDTSSIGRCHIDLGHQEVQRIVEELDNIYEMSQSEWLCAEPISGFICTQLGYGDVDELEDALNGTFEEFLDVLPHIETKRVEGADDDDDHMSLFFRVQRPGLYPVKISLKIDERQQLWNILLKSPTGSLGISELEFEILPEGKRRIDTIWGDLAGAALDLEVRLQQKENETEMSGASVDDNMEIAELRRVIDGLRAIRDADGSWTLIVNDPNGASHFTDSSLVEIIKGPPSPQST